MTGSRTALQVDGSTRPLLPRQVKLRHDERRDRWVLLAPERVLLPDPIAIEVLRLCDGRTVDAIADHLAETYTAQRSEIVRDVVTMLQQLADDGYLVERAPESGRG